MSEQHSTTIASLLGRGQLQHLHCKSMRAKSDLWMNINANFDQVSLKAIKVPYLHHIVNKKIFLLMYNIYFSSVIMIPFWQVESQISPKTKAFPLVCIGFAEFDHNFGQHQLVLHHSQQWAKKCPSIKSIETNLL